MIRNGGSNFHARKLPSNDQDLPAAAVRVCKQAFKVSILAAVDDGDFWLRGQARWHNWATEIATADEKIVERAGVNLGVIGPHVYSPAIAVNELRPLDLAPEPELCIPTVPLQIPFEVLTDLPRTWELRVIALPRKVAELHGVLALVGKHERVNQSGTITFAQRP